MVSGDIGSIYYQIENSNNYNVWDVRANAPTLIMVPASQTIGVVGQTVKFSVTVNGGATVSAASGSRSRYYNWSCGTVGTVSDGKTTSDSIGGSLSQVVTYAVVSSTLPSSPDTVTVTVFDPAGIEIGTVTGTVKFQATTDVGNWVGDYICPAKGGYVTTYHVYQSPYSNPYMSDSVMQVVGLVPGPHDNLLIFGTNTGTGQGVFNASFLQASSPINAVRGSTAGQPGALTLNGTTLEGTGAFVDMTGCTR